MDFMYSVVQRTTMEHSEWRAVVKLRANERIHNSMTLHRVHIRRYPVFIDLDLDLDLANPPKIYEYTTGSPAVMNNSKTM